MAFSDAMALVPDDLPDGAFFAMAHELAGLEYGDGFAELAGDGGASGLSKSAKRRRRRKAAKQQEAGR
jgi:hypothetical protein